MYGRTTTKSVTPEDALHAFLDGELPSGIDEQQLFDELANAPELRTELKDALQIRDAVHRDVLQPSEKSEAALMAALGLPTGLQGASGVAAAGTSWLAGASSSAMYGIGGVAAGILIACMFFVQNNVPQLVTSQPTTQNGSAVAGQSTSERVRLEQQLQETQTSSNKRRQIYWPHKSELLCYALPWQAEMLMCASYSN